MRAAYRARAVVSFHECIDEFLDLGTGGDLFELALAISAQRLTMIDMIAPFR
jgi:hypothetical protein